ncbi:MAG: hypothetical protein ABR502_02615 [Chitinophagaceae bacterium]
MADWRQDIDDLLKHQGFVKKLPELSDHDQTTIQEFLENVGKPAFENISDQLNSFQNVRSEVIPAKKTANSVIEPFELFVYKMAQPKLTYRLHFSKKENGVHINGEYSIPNIYGENSRFQISSLDRILAGTTEEDIASDFFFILKSKF